MSSLPYSHPHGPVAPAPTAVRITRRSILAATLALSLTAVAAIYTFYRRDLNEARNAAAAGSTIVATSCGPVEYAERGVGPAVLSLHGTGGGWDQGLSIARGLVERGYRVIAPSRYGYLRTPMPAYATPQREARLLACFLYAVGI